MRLMALGVFSQHTATVESSTPGRLNAPYGARCFLTSGFVHPHGSDLHVLMRLMVLGAFSHISQDEFNSSVESVLIDLMALDAF